MATIQTQVRVDADVKAQITELFDTLGLDFSSAVNIFLRQCLMRGGLPFEVRVPSYTDRLRKAAAEADELAANGYAKTFDSFDALEQDILKDDEV